MAMEHAVTPTSYMPDAPTRLSHGWFRRSTVYSIQAPAGNTSPMKNKPVSLHRHDEVEAQRGARRQQRGTRAKNIVGIVGGPVAELAL
jgi:hypothetical protein